MQFNIFEEGKDIMVNYGSNIKFAEARNDWIASASIIENDTIFIRENKIWKEDSLNHVAKRITDVIPHETIHNILYCEGLDHGHMYDYIRDKIIYNKKLSPKMREYYYKCM